MSELLTTRPSRPGETAEYPGDRLLSSADLTAKIQPFDSFWEGPERVEAGYRSLGQFYRHNYLPRIPADRHARILVVSCGPGYFLQLLRDEGYTGALGIDADPQKIAPGLARGLNCQAARAIPFLNAAKEPFDAIFCEQELNHLTKEEMILFLRLCRSRLRPGGSLIVHGINGANPIVGAESLAQNFDHYNTFTAYSLHQVLEYCGLEDIRVWGPHLYVFYRNPLNYVAWGCASLIGLVCSALFVLYGKKNRIWTKKIAAVARVPVSRTVREAAPRTG